MQGGLQLPDREYYLSDSESMRKIRAQYQPHIAAMLKVAGFSDAEARASRIFELEHAIAQSHRGLADSEGIHKADNTWTQADFASKAPGLDWTEYFRGAGIAPQGSFIVWQPEAFTGESALVASTSLEAWKDWLSFHLIEAYAGVLPKALADERFAFFGKTLSGAQQQRPRWQRGVSLVNDQLGDVVGQAYAQRYFSPEAKAQAEAMVANLIAAFRKRIEALAWMDAEAEQLLDRMLSRLGLEFLRRRDKRHQRDVHEQGVIATQFLAHLPDSFHKRQRLNIPYRAPNFHNSDVDILRHFLHGSFNFIGHVRNDLHSFAQIIAPPFFGDDLLVNPASSPVVIAGQLGVGEALVMAEIEISLGAVVGDEYLSVLEGRHGARIHIEVGIELHQVDFQPATFQQAAHRSRRQTLAQ